MKKLASATAIVVAILIVGLALWQMVEAIQLFFIALAISAGLSRVMIWLNERGVSRPWAIGVVVLGTIVTLGLLIAAGGTQLLAELNYAAASLPDWYDGMRQELISQNGWAAGVARDLPTSAGLVARFAGADALPSLITNLAAGLAVNAILALSAISLGFYWLLDQERIERLWLSFMPLQARSRARNVWSSVYIEVGRYIRTEVVRSLLTGVCLLAIYLACGIPGAALLALFGGIAVVVPVLGGFFALMPLVLVVLGKSSLLGFVALALAAIVLTLIALVVTPRLIRQNTSVNPVLTIICIMALGELGGLWLIIFGPPLAAAIQTSVQALRQPHIVDTTLTTENSAALSALQERLNTIEAETPADQPQVSSLVGRARGLVSAVGNAFERS